MLEIYLAINYFQAIVIVLDEFFDGKCCRAKVFELTESFIYCFVNDFL